MIPRILSVAGPLLVYVSLGVLLWALYRHRGRLDRSALGVFVLSIAVCFVFVRSGHRVYFDEDIYIQIASNLSRAPVAQLTLLGTPETVEVSTYYKEPVGYPSLLGLVFALFGATEGVAFLLTRVLFAFLVTGVYLLARDGFKQGWMAWIAAMTFLGVPVVLDYSVSAGTDIPMALFTVVGLWGMVSGAPALAVAGLALAVQMRLEAVVLTSLLVLSPTISRKWKFIGLISGFGRAVSSCVAPLHRPGIRRRNRNRIDVLSGVCSRQPDIFRQIPVRPESVSMGHFSSRVAVGARLGVEPRTALAGSARGRGAGSFGGPLPDGVDWTAHVRVSGLLRWEF